MCEKEKLFDVPAKGLYSVLKAMEAVGVNEAVLEAGVMRFTDLAHAQTLEIRTPWAFNTDIVLTTKTLSALTDREGEFLGELEDQVVCLEKVDGASISYLRVLYGIDDPPCDIIKKYRVSSGACYPLSNYPNLSGLCSPLVLSSQMIRMVYQTLKESLLSSEYSKFVVSKHRMEILHGEEGGSSVVAYFADQEIEGEVSSHIDNLLAYKIFSLLHDFGVSEVLFQGGEYYPFVLSWKLPHKHNDGIRFTWLCAPRYVEAL